MKTFWSLPHTPSDVKDAICNSLQLWLDPTDMDNLANTAGLQDVMSAVTSQDDIGWNHFVRGRVSMDWGAIINSHLQLNTITNFMAEQWRSKMIEINWKYVLQIWDLQNEETIGKTKEDILNKRKVKVLIE